MDLWLPAWLGRERQRNVAPTDVLIAICDHFEPFHDVNRETALRRVQRWRKAYPQVTSDFPDASGTRPKHTFFYPIEQYDEVVVGEIAALCLETGCEMEIHLHHENDSAENLRATLEEGKRRLRSHGQLATNAKGEVQFGFIHGNWALDNSHPKGRGCGVRGELQVLREAGCYADFTMPSAPHRCQTRTINQLYYAIQTGHRKSHDDGIRARVGSQTEADLLCVQGPLGLDWQRRKAGIMPCVENGDLTGANPPTLDRAKLWRDIGIHVAGRPEWLFVKLHTHGGIERNSDMLLGEAMRSFRAGLRELPLRHHWVTAREMVNILHAAENGHAGNPSEYRDYLLRR